MKLSRLPLLSAAALSIFAMTTLAADTTLPNLSNAISSQAAAASSATADATDKTDKASATKATATGKNSGSDAATTTGKGSATSTGPSPTAVITGSGSAGATTGTIPSITGGGSATSGGGLPKGLPTLSGAFVIVAPSVPPTADAPFMRVSNMPEGTVFIVVGAVLGFMAMSVLLWRGLVAWSLHRSVKRAALHQNMSDTKAHFRTPGVPVAPFYQYKDRESTHSLGGLGGGNKRKPARPTTAPGAAAQTTLFFSPTAGAAGGGINQAGNRGSNYLPAGYYAAGAAQPGNGQGMTHIGQQPSISLSNLGPARDGYTRAHSPPGSPHFTAHRGNMSSSTLNVNQVPGEQRTPSTYLDDLFDAENAPPLPGQHNGARF